MVASPLVYEIRRSPSSDGGVRLELVVDGATIARAAVDASVLADMNTTLGLDQESVVAELQEALRSTLARRGQFVEITSITEDRARPLRFSGHFVYRLGDEVSTGTVWYDVNTSNTGPEGLPAVILNKMRFEVHRKLTGEGSAARALVDLHK